MKTQVSTVSKNHLQVLPIITIAISFFVIVGWVFKVEALLKIFAGGSEMKFNTALLFLLTSVALLPNFKNYQIFRIAFLLFVFIIASITLVSYALPIGFDLDNFFIADKYSQIFAGRMSKGTAICFMFLASGELLKSYKTKSVQLVIQTLFFTVLTVVFITLVSTFLDIPSDKRTSILETMAFNTAFSFALLAYVAISTDITYGPVNIFMGNLVGTKFIRSALPVVLLIPLLFSYVLLYLVNDYELDSSFAIVVYTVILIIVFTSFLVFAAFQINQANKQLQFKNEELNEARSHYLSIFKTASLPIVITKNGWLVEFNEAAHKQTGYTSEEYAKLHMNQIDVNRASDTEILDIVKRIEKDGFVSFEAKHRTKKGQLLDIVVNASNLVINGENHVLAIFNDITENNKIKNAIQEKNKELEQFVYIASHDLQEPLRTVSSFVDVLYEDFPNIDSDAKTYLSIINESTQRMRRMVQDLMDHSRLNKKLKFENVITADIIKHIINDFSLAIKESKAVLEIGALPIIYGSDIAIRQLFQNLISNALKFKRNNVAPLVSIECKELEEYWQFSVTDNGIGIAEKNLNKIFKIFQRLHSETDYKGTGIGLANCKKIVEIHGGRIWVKSKLDEGSTFYFTIKKQL